MRKTIQPCILAALLLAGCAKENREVAQEVGLLPAGCGVAGARLEASIGSTAFCADLHLSAVGGEGSVIVTGIGLGTATLVLQFDDLAPGEHAVTEAGNGVLYMQAGEVWTVPPGVSGLLRIDAHDPATNRLAAHWEVTLLHETSGESRSLVADLEVTYTTE